MRKVILIIGAITVVAITTFGQYSSWGGKGEVSVNPVRVPSGGGVEIKYYVSESRGTGTASFTCEVTGPGGVIHVAKVASTKWSGGEAWASFIYPRDFGGNDSFKPSTNTRGTYQIQCYWYISGYGVNGKIAAGGGAFIID